MDRLGEYWRILRIWFAVAVGIALFGLFIRMLLIEDAKDSRAHEAKAHSLVAQACGREAARKFTLIYDGTDPYDQVDEARNWAKKCLAGQ